MSTRRKKVLGVLLVAMALIAMCAIGYPFAASLWPSARAINLEIVEVDLKDLDESSYKVVQWRGSEILIYRRNSDQLKKLNNVPPDLDVYEWNYLAEWGSSPEKKDDPFRTSLGEYLVVLVKREKCDIEFTERRPASVSVEHWAGSGFYSPCEDAYFDLSGRLFAEYKERRVRNMERFGYWSPSMYLIMPPHSFKSKSVLVIGNWDGTYRGL